MHAIDSWDGTIKCVDVLGLACETSTKTRFQSSKFPCNISVTLTARVRLHGADITLTSPFPAKHPLTATIVPETKNPVRQSNLILFAQAHGVSHVGSYCIYRNPKPFTLTCTYPLCTLDYPHQTTTTNTCPFKILTVNLDYTIAA
jgi:hypothetical protein